MRALLAFLMALSLSWSTTATAHVERLELHVSETLTLPTRAKGYDAKESSHPSTGRFLSLDPFAGSLSEPLSTQGFTYAHANPTRFTDPDGRIANGVAAIIGGVVGVVAGCALGAWHAEEGNGWKECAIGGGVGAVSGAIAGLTFGATLAAQGATAATATTAQLATAGMVSGAVSGGVGGGLGTAAHGGSAEEVIQNAAVGTLVGGVGGFVGGGLFGAVAPSLSTTGQRVLGGGLSALGGDLVAQTTNSFLTGAAFDPAQAVLSTTLGGTFAGASGPRRPNQSRPRSRQGSMDGGEFAADFPLFRDQPAAELVRNASSNAADAAAGVRPLTRRPNAAGAIVADDLVITGGSVRGGLRPPLAPGVEGSLAALEASGAPLGAGHGCCFEPQGLSRLEVRGANTVGGLAAARNVRSNPTHPQHGTDLPACSTCRVLLNERGIQDINSGLTQEPKVIWSGPDPVPR